MVFRCLSESDLSKRSINTLYVNLLAKVACAGDSTTFSVLSDCTAFRAMSQTSDFQLGHYNLIIDYLGRPPSLAPSDLQYRGLCNPGIGPNRSLDSGRSRRKPTGACRIVGTMSSESKPLEKDTTIGGSFLLQLYWLRLRSGKTKACRDIPTIPELLLQYVRCENVGHAIQGSLQTC